MTAPSFLVLIAGGSGSGKSTLAEGLKGRFPDWALVHLDDYQKTKDQVPKVDGRRNWDEPSVVDFDKLIRDVEALQGGESVEIEGWARGEDRNKFLRERFTVVSGPTIVVEGYFALWHPRLREMADFRVFLDVPAVTRHARRLWIKSQGYLDQVLEPMHQLHIEPTKAFADLIVFAGSSPADSVLETVSRCLKAFLT